MFNFSIPEGYDVVGVRLSNGMLKIVKGDSINEVISEEEFVSRFGPINEGVNTNKVLIMEPING